MTNPVDDVVQQARLGSVAAIIQVLNEKLADSGVRTRAVLADGVLQLLCEAATVEQLEPSVLIEQIRAILQTIAPRSIHRVNINSRIVREQQLLWLEEISRDPENQLLWSREITLKRPNLFQQLFWKRQPRKADPSQSLLTQLSPRQLREQRQFWKGGLLGGATVGLVVLGCWGLYSRFGMPLAQLKPTQPELNSSQNQLDASALPPTDQASTVPQFTQPSPRSLAEPLANTDSVEHPFVSAVRIAEKASQKGRTAQSSAEWLELAARWREAADLMASVPATDKRYGTAQKRVLAYRKNSESALQRAR